MLTPIHFNGWFPSHSLYADFVCCESDKAPKVKEFRSRGKRLDKDEGLKEYKES